MVVQWVITSNNVSLPADAGMGMKNQTIASKQAWEARKLSSSLLTFLRYQASAVLWALELET